MLEKVYQVVQQNGPTLPVEVSKKLGIDSLVAAAYLSQLVEAGKIRISKERVGNAFVYFLPGQEQAAQLKIKKLLEQSQKTVKQFQSEPATVTPEIEQKRAEFVQRLKEIEEREERERRKQTEIKTEKEDFIERFKQAITPFLSQREEEVKTEIAKEPKKIEIKKIRKRKTLFGPKVDIVELATNYLTERGAEILSKNVKKKKEAEFIVKIPSGIGPVKMFVKVKDKKSINEADLSLTYTQGQNQKLPVLFLTTGKLTKTAQNYLKVIGGLLKVKILEPENK